MPALVIVDGANVVGSVPDGWWKDRAGAARRLRDALAALPTQALDGLEPPLDVVLVVEGAARSVAQEPAPTGVRVVAAERSGDDMIVDLVAAHRLRDPGDDGPADRDPGDGEPAVSATGEREVVVVTADRGLRERVTVLGARVVGPRTVRPR